MPVSRSDPRRAIIIGIGAVVAAVALGFLMFSLSGERGRVRVGGRDAEFDLGDAEDRAEAIERDGVPLLFQDPANFERPIYVQHVGSDPAEGWRAFDAQIGGCVIDWDRGAEEFVDCEGERYPADGEGLPQYEARVEDGNVVVDLNPDDDETTTTETPTTIRRTGDPGS